MPIEKESPEQLGYDLIRYNLTESSVRDRKLSDLGFTLEDMTLFYGDHVGHPGLREEIARISGENITPNDVLITAGAAGALFIIATSLLEQGDHLVVEKPNYSTNIETPRAIGADISFLDLTYEDEFALDVSRIESMIRPETRYVSLTCPHNPTGTVMTINDLKRAIDLVEQKGCRLLVDETYREMTFGKPLPVAASLSNKAISVSSLSKTYGIPGIRIGWLVCRDPELMETLLSAKEQIGICGSVVDEEIAYRAILGREEWLQLNNRHISDSFSTIKEWMENQTEFEWIEPSGGVVCFPRISPEIDVDIDNFYKILNEKYGTYVGPGHWFEMPRRFMRLGYGWPDIPDLKAGLSNITRAVREAMK